MQFDEFSIVLVHGLIFLQNFLSQKVGCFV